MKRSRLYDWNDARLLIACAEQGSFVRAANILGIDQTTASRRISALEEEIGRPLFTRRRSGASLTAAGRALVEHARQLEASVLAFEQAMEGMQDIPAPMVTIAASEGLLSYTLIPALLGGSSITPAIDASLMRAPPPELAFTTSFRKADISIFATSPGQIPDIQGNVHVKKIGAMNFVPVATKQFMEDNPGIRDFDDLRDLTLVDNEIYHCLKGLDDWNALVAEQEAGTVTVAPNTRAVGDLVVEGKGVTVLPPYAQLCVEELLVLDVPSPSMSADLWLAAHEDGLREPAIRMLYDSLSEMFQKSVWYRKLN